MPTECLPVESVDQPLVEASGEALLDLARKWLGDPLDIRVQNWMRAVPPSEGGRYVRRLHMLVDTLVNALSTN